MSFDFSSLFWVFFAIMVLQPLLMGRWYTMQRAQAIRALEKSHASRVITMIHRQEKRSLFGFAVSRQIDLEDAQTIIAAIKDPEARCFLGLNQRGRGQRCHVGMTPLRF